MLAAMQREPSPQVSSGEEKYCDGGLPRPTIYRFHGGQGCPRVRDMKVEEILGIYVACSEGGEEPNCGDCPLYDEISLNYEGVRIKYSPCLLLAEIAKNIKQNVKL